MKALAISTAAAAFALIAACAHPQTQAPASAQTAIPDLERQSWVAWQHHDGAFFAHFLSDDHVEVHPTGPATKAQIVPFVASGACTVTSYTLGDMSVTQFSPDSAVITYRAEQDTVCGGAHVPSPVWVTSGYVLREGRWQNAVYVQTPIAGS
jgi:hypothetical protein